MNNKYVIVYSDNMKLCDSYITIIGKNANDALEHYYHCKFKRVYRDDKKYADIILVKGYFQNNKIICDGAYRTYCYSIIKNNVIKMK